MPDVDKHAWTHRPREEGGTDPIAVASGGQWCRLGFSEDYTVPLASGPDRVLDFDVPANHDPTYYTIVNASGGGTDNAIQINKNGVYAVTFGIYVDVFTPLFPTVPIWVWFKHTTWTHEVENFHFDLTDTGLVNNASSPILTGSKVFRSGPDFDPVFMGITSQTSPGSDLGIVGGDLNISYMEIVRLSPSGPNTDPNDSAVFP